MRNPIPAPPKPEIKPQPAAKPPARDYTPPRLAKPVLTKVK